MSCLLTAWYHDCAVLRILTIWYKNASMPLSNGITLAPITVSAPPLYTPMFLTELLRIYSSRMEDIQQQNSTTLAVGWATDDALGVCGIISLLVTLFPGQMTTPSQERVASFLISLLTYLYHVRWVISNMLKLHVNVGLYVCVVVLALSPLWMTRASLIASRVCMRLASMIRLAKLCTSGARFNGVKHGVWFWLTHRVICMG